MADIPMKKGPDGSFEYDVPKSLRDAFDRAVERVEKEGPGSKVIVIDSLPAMGGACIDTTFSGKQHFMLPSNFDQMELRILSTMEMCPEDVLRRIGNSMTRRMSSDPNKDRQLAMQAGFRAIYGGKFNSSKMEYPDPVDHEVLTAEEKRHRKERMEVEGRKSLRQTRDRARMRHQLADNLKHGKRSR